MNEDFAGITEEASDNTCDETAERRTAEDCTLEAWLDEIAWLTEDRGDDWNKEETVWLGVEDTWDEAL